MTQHATWQRCYCCWHRNCSRNFSLPVEHDTFNLKTEENLERCHRINLHHFDLNQKVQDGEKLHTIPIHSLWPILFQIWTLGLPTAMPTMQNTKITLAHNVINPKGNYYQVSAI